MKKILFIISLLIIFVSDVKAFDIDMSKIDINARSRDVIASFDMNYKINTDSFEESIINDRSAIIYTNNLVKVSFDEMDQETTKKNIFNHLYLDVDGRTATYSEIYVSQLFDNNIKMGVISDIKTASFNEENVIVFVYVKEAEVNLVKKDIVLNYWLKYDNGEYSLYLPWITYSNEIEEYFENISYNEETGKIVGDSYNKFVLDGNKNNVTDNLLEDLYNSNRDSVVQISSMKDSTFYNGSGFFIREGIVATTWSFFLEFLNNGDYLYINDSYGKTYDVEGVVSAVPEYDIVLLKISKEFGKPVQFGNANELYANANLFTINSKNNNRFSINYGNNISVKNGKFKNMFPLTDGDVGSALFNQYGEVVAFAVKDKLNSELSFANSTDSLKKIQNRLKEIKYENIKYVSLDKFKAKYYISLDEEKTYNKVPTERWNSLKKIGLLEDKIDIELLKASYTDRILSLRYANSAKGMLNSIYLASGFTEELLKQGYELTFYNDQKTIYKNDDYQIVIKDNFDYLIILIMEI